MGSMSNILDNILEKVGGKLPDPSTIISNLGQEVLDKLIDKVTTACNEEIRQSELEPLVIEDITIPFSLAPCASFLSRLSSCLTKNGRGRNISEEWTVERTVHNIQKYSDQSGDRRWQYKANGRPRSSEPPVPI